MIEQTMKYFWFRDHGENYKRLIKTDSEKIFYEHLVRFQSGDFSLKKEFVEFFLDSEEWDIFVLGMRLFMAVCNHDDLELLADFLSDCEENQLRVFLAYVQESLTIQAVPYLLALFEDWEETHVGDDIARCICEMLDKEYFEEQHFKVEELGEYFTNFSNENKLSLYFYKGKEFFTGNLTKKTISVAMYCRDKEWKFFTSQMSSILSNSTGIECPVYYGVEIDDVKIQQLFGYVNSITELHQEVGKKYFFNYQII